MSNKIWYLPGPFHHYQEDVKALAREAGLRIIDANVTTSREDAAENPPKVTIKEATAQAVLIVGAGSSVDINALRRELEAVGLIVESFAEQDLVRPEGAIGPVADRLFQVLEAVNGGVQSLVNERDGEAAKAGALQKQVDDLLAQAAKARLETEESREVKEVAELKAKLDAAGVTYRANASKEVLEKLVADLSKD